MAIHAERAIGHEKKSELSWTMIGRGRVLHEKRVS